MTNDPYLRLKSRFNRIGALGEAHAMLGWDASAMMPEGGGASRGEQLAVLAGQSHELLTAPVVAEDLAAAEAAGYQVATITLEARGRCSACRAG